MHEELLDDGTGDAPQPGIATLLIANDHTKMKTYDVILNPSFRPTPADATPMSLDEPSAPAQLMAAAWAAEMLHIDFYAHGISLPHHARADFQEQWREIARELGFPRLPHGDTDEIAAERSRRRPTVIIWRAQ